MGLLLDRIDRKKNLKKWVAVFVINFSFKLILAVIVIWMFLTIRSDWIEMYSRCEPFIVHAINLSNATFQNITNLTIVLPA